MGKNSKSYFGRVFHRFQKDDGESKRPPRAESSVAIFSATPDLLSQDEARLLDALLDQAVEDGLVPARHFTAAGLAAAMGQKHTGNLSQLVRSLERKGFIKFMGPRTDMFHVKRPLGSVND